jgi:hypothetical protein
VLALELQELAADVLCRLLRRGVHRRRGGGGEGEGFGFGCAGMVRWERVCGLLESSGALYEKFTSATTGPGPRATISYGPVRCGRVAARPVGKVHASGVI